MITVALNGCFDILHIGHIKLLKYAKSLGHKLIVGINSDKSVKLLKGKLRPINNETERKEFLLSIKYVDEVFIFNEKNAVNFLKQVKPDFYIKGGDYNLKNMNQDELSYLQSINSSIKFYSYVDNHSTSSIIEKISKL